MGTVCRDNAWKTVGGDRGSGLWLVVARCMDRDATLLVGLTTAPGQQQIDHQNKARHPNQRLTIAKRNTPEGDRLDVLVTLVEAWERKHYPMDLPTRWDQNGLQPRDLIPFIGSRNCVHEVLNRRRSLTLKMIWRLHEGLGIPAESLIKVGQEQAA
jgi:HTH-type transcriptional regulator/antitoxin HigA